MKKCRNCSEPFTPRFSTLEKYCWSPECKTIEAMEKLEKKKKAQKKAWNKEKKVRKEKLMTRTDHLNLLQKVFNAYIRQRDKELPCISCGRQIGKYNTHASHYFSVGAYPNLRFNEDNVHASCDHCNLHLHGNIAEYSIRLPKRIGLERFNELKCCRNGDPLKLIVDEIKEKIKYYRKKTKELK